MKHQKKKLNRDTKYSLYEKAVQSPDADIDFLLETYTQLNNKSPTSLREDFCGTGLLLCEWVKREKNFWAVGLDFDSEPTEYGIRKHLSKLKPAQKERVRYLNQDVLVSTDLKTDIITAFNFSYMIFKERSVLLGYFKNIRKSLQDDGLFCLDNFGGTQCHQKIKDKKIFSNFSYFWECQEFNPINNHCQYAIHFKYKDFLYKNAFSYDWRFWTPAELRDLLTEAGFKEIIVYWEQDEPVNESYFTKEEKAENVPAWICYIVARK